MSTCPGAPRQEDHVTYTRERYQRIAPLYDLLDLPFEYRRYRHLRPLLFKDINGTILDAGVGTGRNFPFYPIGAKVLGIDLSPAMLERARRRLGEARADVELREMDVTQLDFPDQHFDGAVATFLFCVLPDALQTPALAEIRRVLKPGGIVRLLEYTRPTAPFRRALTKIWEPWGLRGELRSPHRTLRSRSRTATHGLSLRDRRSHPAHYGAGGLRDRHQQ